MMLSDIERCEHIISLLIKENKELKKENDELKYKIYQKKEEDEEIEIKLPYVNNFDDVETVILEEDNENEDDDTDNNVEIVPKVETDYKKVPEIEKVSKVKRDRSFDGYVKKYIPDGQELIMQFKKNNNIIEIKCTVDYKSSKFINEDGEQCKSLNMVLQNKCKKLGIKADKDCWKMFKMNGKSIDNLYE